MIKKICILVVVLLYSSLSFAEPAYIDLVYKDSLSVLPQEREWFKKLFSDQQRKVFLVVSVSKKNSADGKNVLLVPPRILESFERSGSELKRTKSDNLRLLTSQFANPNEQIVLKVEFFSVEITQANAFTESLKSLASAYIAAGSSPAVSEVVTSAMKAIESILLGNKELYLTYNGGLPIDAPSREISLYFDDSGNINDSIFDGANSSKKVVFQLDVKPSFIVSYNYSFENQGINEAERIAYRKLTEVKSPSDRRDACIALRNTLKRRFSGSIANDLTAIAINDIEWPQDETQYNCIKASEAVKYKRERGLNNIANCTIDECTGTKKILFFLEANTDQEIINSVANTDEYSRSCRDTTQFSRLYRWSNVNSIFENQTFRSYSVKSCLETPEGKFPYLHKFSWLDGALTSHSCDKSNTDNYCN